MSIIIPGDQSSQSSKSISAPEPVQVDNKADAPKEVKTPNNTGGDFLNPQTPINLDDFKLATEEDIQKGRLDVPDEIDTEFLLNGFDNDEIQESAGIMKNQFTPSATSAMLHDPLKAIMLHGEVDKKTALRTMSIAAAAPNIPVGVLEGDNEVLDYAENELAKSKEIQAYDKLKREDPQFVSSLTDPNIARIILHDTADGEMAWQRLRELELERNGSALEYFGQTLRVAGSQWAKLKVGTVRTVSRLLDSMNDGYLKTIENGCLTIEQEKSKSDIADLEQQYNGQIEALKLDFEKHKGTDTGLKLSRQIIDLEEKRNEAVRLIKERGDSQVDEEIGIAKVVSAEMKEATRKIDEYMDLAPWLNHNLPQTDSVVGNFLMQLVVAGPQMAEQIGSYAVGAGVLGLGLMGAQVFSSSFNDMDREGVSLEIAVPTALLRTVPEVVGDWLTLGFLDDGIKVARKVIGNTSVAKDALLTLGSGVLKAGAKEAVTEGAQNFVGTAIELTGIGISGVKTPQELAQRMYDEGIVGSIQEGLIAAVYVMPSVVALAKVHGARIKDAYKRTKILKDTIKTAEKISGIKDSVVREKIIEANSPKLKVPDAEPIEPRSEPWSTPKDSALHDFIENDAGEYVRFPRYKDEKLADPEEQERLAKLFDFDVEYFQGKNPDNKIDSKVNEQLQKDFHEKVKEQYEDNQNRIEEQKHQAAASQIISERMKELKIHAGKFKNMLDEHITDPSERSEFLNSLAIDEKDILFESEHNGYVSTNINKVLAHANSTFWEELAPYTKQYNQEMSLAEAEQFTQAFGAVSDHIKDLERAEIEVTATEREEAAVKMLREVFPKRSDRRFLRPVAAIMTKVFESIEKGIITDSRGAIMSNLSQGFAVRRGEAGDIHFLHKNDLMDIREQRIKLAEKSQKSEAETNESQPELYDEDIQLKAKEKEEAYFRGVSSVGENTTKALGDIDADQDFIISNGKTLIDAMKADGAVRDNEYNLFVNEEGTLTEDGKEFIHDLLLSRFVDNTAVLDSLKVTMKRKLSKITPYLLAVDSINPEKSLLPEFREALLYSSNLKKKKVTDLKSISSKLETWLSKRPVKHLEQASQAYLRTVKADSDLSKEQLADEIIRFGEDFSPSQDESTESPQLKALKLDPVKIKDVPETNTKSMGDDEAQRFVLTPDNQKNWGVITEDQANAINSQIGSHIKPNTPIRLQVGHHKLTGGFGLIHMIEGKKKAGKDTRLLQNITTNFDEIRASRNRLILVKKGVDEKHESAFVELIINKYYSIITQYSVKNKRLKKMPLLWSRSADPQLDSQPESPDLKTNANSSAINEAETTPRSAGPQGNGTEESPRNTNPHHVHTSPSEGTGFDDAITNIEDGSKSSGAIPQGNEMPLPWSRSSYPQLDSQPESPALEANANSSAINEAEITPRSAGQQGNGTENIMPSTDNILPADVIVNENINTNNKPETLPTSEDLEAESILEDENEERNLSDSELKVDQAIKDRNQEYQQNGVNSEYRGKIIFNEDAFSSLITLARDGDVTTFLHEISHFWLHTVEQLVGSGNATNELVAQFNKVKKALNVKDGDSLSTKNHEYFARSWEAYLTSGEAPTGMLLRTFSALKRFATSIYRYLKNTYGDEGVNPDLKDVFEHILATDEELARYKKETELTKETADYSRDVKKELFGDEAEKKERAAKQYSIDKEERLFKRVNRYFAKNGGYENARKAAEKEIAKDPFYGAIKEIVDTGGINIDKLRWYLDDRSIEYINKRHSSKDKPFITEEDTDISLLEIADRAGYGDTDLPVETFFNDLIGNPNLSEASDVLFEENKEIVRQQLRKELQNRELLSIDNTVDEVENMLFDAAAYRMAFIEIEEKNNDYQERRAIAREQRNIIQNEIEAELSNQEVWKATNYKYHQNKSNKLGKEVDGLVRKLRSITKKDFKTFKRRGKQRAEVREIIDEIERLQKERARAALSAKYSLEINDKLRVIEREMGSRRLISALNNVREDFRQSIINMVYAYKLPAAIHPKGGVNLNLAQTHNADIKQLNKSPQIVLPNEVDLPVNERDNFSVPSEDLMADWIRNKQNIGKDSYRDMRWGDLEELKWVIDAYIARGSEELDLLKYEGIETKEKAIAYLKYNTKNMKAHTPIKGEDPFSKSKIKNVAVNTSKEKVRKAKNIAKELPAFFGMLEFDFLKMDNNERGFYYNIFTNMRKAGIRFNKRMLDLSEKVQPYYNVLSNEIEAMKMRHGSTQLKDFSVIPTEAFVNAYKQKYYTPENIVTMCLNMGNDSNLLSLVAGHEFGKERWDSWLKSLEEGEYESMSDYAKFEKRIELAKPELDAIKAEISTEGWIAIQKLLDINDSLFKEYNAAAYKIYKRNLTQEKPMPIVIDRTADGESITLRGGYLPLAVDKRLTAFNFGEDIGTKPADMINRHSSPYSRSGINKSATISRMRSSQDGAPVVTRPIKLTLDILPRHYENITRFITHSDIMQETDKIFHDNEFRSIYEEKFGAAKYKELLKWHDSQVNPRIFDYDKAVLNKGMRLANSMLSIGALGGNVGSAMKQGLSTTGGINVMNQESQKNGGNRFAGWYYYGLGQKLYLKGVKDVMEGKTFVGNSASNFMFNASETMEGRNLGGYNLYTSDTNERHILDQGLSFKNRKSGKKITISKESITKISFAMLHAVDKATVTPIWIGAFHQSLAHQGVEFRSDLNEYLSDEFKNMHPGALEEAVNFADSVISRSQPMTLSTDKAPIQQHQFWKMFAVFGSYTLRLFNRLGFEYNKFIGSKHSIKEWEVANMAQFFIETFIPPAMAVVLGRYAFFENDDEEERSLTKFFKDVGYETGMQVLATAPFLRDIPDIGNSFRGGMIKMPAFQNLNNKIGAAYRAVRKGELGDAAYESIDLVGSIYGIPFSNIKKNTHRGWELYKNGKISSKKKKGDD